MNAHKPPVVNVQSQHTTLFIDTAVRYEGYSKLERFEKALKVSFDWPLSFFYSFVECVETTASGESTCTST